jgi:microcystin-dependent protein
MPTVHRNLTGADLHEPKGAETALSGQVYVADGAGSGVWTTASSIITNTAFTTGDTKITLKASADSGWILGGAGSIGDGSSSATLRANSDCEALFLLLWTNFSDALAPVSSGRGASAAADWASHKRITLPDMWQRVIGVAGAYNGSGQTTRTLGAIVGAETHTLTLSEIPSHSHANTLNDPGHFHNEQISGSGGLGSYVVNQNGSGVVGISNVNTTVNTTGITINNVAAGGGGAHNNMQPTVFLNLMIKL